MNKNPTRLSGRWLITILLLVCFSMVLWALWQRSRDTGQVRKFWGAEAAACIQRGQVVRLRRPLDANLNSIAHDDDSWQDISAAPGLIHLRATLVDDRYFQWPAAPSATLDKPSLENPSLDASSPEAPVREPSAYYQLQFEDDHQRVDLALELETGNVINVSTHQSVRLIESSRRALETYFQLPELRAKPR